MESVLSRATASDVYEAPFPHLVIQGALSAEYYDQLDATFPEPAVILDGRVPESNRNYRYAASKVFADPRISQLWRDFVRYHVSQDFFDEVRTLFGDRIRRLHPQLEHGMGSPMSAWQTSVRFRESARDVAMECQFAYGSPVKQASRMIGPHVDRECALYAGLFYMRDVGDASEGGMLELYQFRRDPIFFSDRHYVPDGEAEVVKTIPYARNTLVMFPHSIHAVHGVSPRSQTTFSRRHVNFVGELAQKVFDVGSFIQHENRASY